MQGNADRQHSLCPGYKFDQSTAPSEGDGEDRAFGYFVSPQDIALCPISAYAHLSVEFKPDGTDYDPFSHHCDDSESAADTRKVVFKDLRKNAQSIHDYQIRTAIFTLFVNGEEFRIIRWDPSGLIVTESINYLRHVDGTRTLLRCLYAFSKLSREKQGYDGNAVRLSKFSCGWQRMFVISHKGSKDDLDDTERIVRDPARVHAVFRDPTASASYGERSTNRLRQLVARDPTLPPPPGQDWHFADVKLMPVMRSIREAFRMSVPQEEPSHEHPRYRIKICGKDYLVGKPVYFENSQPGTDTRTYIALEWHTQRLVFLKDMWTFCYDGLEREGAILTKLNARGIPNVPTVITYEDVHYLEGDAGPQETETSCYSPSAKKKKIVKNLPPVAAVKGISWVRRRSRFFRRIRPDLSIIEIPNNANTKNPPSGRQRPVSVTCMEQARLDIPDIRSKPFPMRFPEDDPDYYVHDYQAPAPLPKVSGKDLLHKVHTRIVLEEVCFAPNFSVRSSRQLVRLFHDAMIGTLRC